MASSESGLSPLCLMVPGLGNSGPGHWQTIWENERPDCVRVELGMWNDPTRNIWISRIDQAVAAAQGPVVLVGHSLGCHAILWWASLLGEDVRGNVAGALLVAPPDVDRPSADPRLTPFAPAPQSLLPFPARLVASTDDPWCAPEQSIELAGAWGADCLLLDHVGHINADSGLGAWREGQDLLEELLDARPTRTLLPDIRPRSAVAASHGPWLEH
ncbi:RBBP9/YdeN family alpha/beta hydrolase [Sphingomonas sp. ASY06-1R]|jgi:predicted alpha/beta hydrolase family esterase|uniref:RBBP9/YdeN family alpha/beta hydrolase n=1 Tax=Sphingomonas sp. ASY06-1R TaxID=3445771 RepID=UPI003FA21C8D